MPDKKPISKSKVRKAIKKVKAVKKGKVKETAKKKSNRSMNMMGNQNSRTWLPKDIKEISNKITELAPHVYSIVEICAKLKISQGIYYDLVDRYTSVSEAHDQAKSEISCKAWSQGFNQQGFPNILQMAIKRHDKQEVKSQLKEIEGIKQVEADIRVNEKRELAEKVDDGNGNVLDEFDEFLRWKAEKKARSL
jgi:hypothetical protein